MGKGKAVLILLILAALIAAGWYFTIYNTEIKQTNDKINATLGNYGLSDQSFKNRLLVWVESDGIKSSVSREKMAELEQDLKDLQQQTAQEQSKTLVGIYVKDVSLSIEKQGILEDAKTFSAGINDSNKMCQGKAEFAAVKEKFGLFYLELNTLVLDEVDYSTKFNAEKPLDLNIDEENTLYSALDLIQTGIDNAC